MCCVNSLFAQPSSVSNLFDEEGTQRIQSEIRKSIEKHFGKKAVLRYHNYLIEYVLAWKPESENLSTRGYIAKDWSLLDSLIANNVPLDRYLKLGKGGWSYVAYDDSLNILCVGDTRWPFNVILLHRFIKIMSKN